jgi:hypothetical protein
VSTKAGQAHTFEEAFALQNMAWCQDEDRQTLGLRIPKSSTKTLSELAQELFRRVKSSTFKKTDFALAVLEQNPAGWTVPSYVAEGLKWLEERLVHRDDESNIAMAPNVAKERSVARTEQADGVQV